MFRRSILMVALSFLMPLTVAAQGVPPPATVKALVIYARDSSGSVATAFFQGDHKFSCAFSSPPGSRVGLGKDKRPLIKQMTVDAIHEMEDQVTFRILFR